MLRSIFVSLLLGLPTAAEAVGGYSAVDYSRTFTPSDPFMNIGLGLSHAFSKMTTLSFSQSIEKNLIVDASRDEFELADSRIGLSLRPRSKIEHVTWNLGFSASLPVSKKSRHDEVITKPEISLGASYATVVTLSASSFFRYQVNRYQSAPAVDGEGGQPLAHYGYGFNLGIGRSVFERLNLALQGSYRETRFEDVPYEGPNVPQIDYSPDGAYSIAFAANVTVGESTEIGASVQQGRVLEQANWSEFVIFDETESSWSISFTQSF